MDASSIDCCYTTLQNLPDKVLVWRKDATRAEVDEQWNFSEGSPGQSGDSPR
jgi:hypothetical protein